MNSVRHSILCARHFHFIYFLFLFFFGCSFSVLLVSYTQFKKSHHCSYISQASYFYCFQARNILKKKRYMSRITDNSKPPKRKFSNMASVRPQTKTKLTKMWRRFQTKQQQQHTHTINIQPTNLVACNYYAFNFSHIEKKKKMINHFLLPFVPAWKFSNVFFLLIRLFVHSIFFSLVFRVSLVRIKGKLLLYSILKYHSFGCLYSLLYA